MSAPPVRPGVPVTVSTGAPVTVSSVPMQVVSKSAAYPAGGPPITYYRPPAPGQAVYPGQFGPGVPQGRVIQSVTPVGQAPVQRIVRTSQPLPLGKSPPSQATRPNTVGGPAYSQSAYETKHEKDEQLQNLKLGTFWSLVVVWRWSALLALAPSCSICIGLFALVAARSIVMICQGAVTQSKVRV